MSRGKYTEDYEDFEPEMRIWPFLLLSVMIPLIPFSMNIFLGRGFSFFLALNYVMAVLPLLSASLCMKDGERAWLFPLSSALYLLLTLVEWAVAKKTGNGGIYPLSVPFALALTPSLLPLVALSFFNKRRRSPWLGWAIVALFMSSILTFLTYSEVSDSSFLWVFYPVLMVLLSLMLFPLTRRTESTPWYFTLLLVLLILSSFTLYPSFSRTVLTGSFSQALSVCVRCFLFSFQFWYTLSFLFVFSALAGKSRYRRNSSADEDADDGAEEIIVPSSDTKRGIDRGYSNPPDYSRYDRTTRQLPVGEEEKAKPVTPDPDSIRERGGERPAAAADDKWFDFLEGGVRNDERVRRSDDRRDIYRERDDRRDRERRAYDERDRSCRDYDRRRDERSSFPPDDICSRRRRDEDERDYERDRDYGRGRGYYERDYERDREYERKMDRDYERDCDYYRRRRYEDDYPPYDDRPMRR